MPTEVIGVLSTHLEEMASALDRATGYFSAMDLADAYRAGSPVPKPSRNTAMIERARDRAFGYLEEEEEEDDDDVQPE